MIVLWLLVMVMSDGVQAILGRGIDNHLLGLHRMAVAEQCAKKTPMPALFLDDSYQTSNHFTLSTSQVNLCLIYTIGATL